MSLITWHCITIWAGFLYMVFQPHRHTPCLPHLSSPQYSIHSGWLSEPLHSPTESSHHEDRIHKSVPTGLSSTKGAWPGSGGQNGLMRDEGERLGHGHWNKWAKKWERAESKWKYTGTELHLIWRLYVCVHAAAPSRFAQTAQYVEADGVLSSRDDKQCDYDIVHNDTCVVKYLFILLSSVPSMDFHKVKLTHLLCSQAVFTTVWVIAPLWNYSVVWKYTIRSLLEQTLFELYLCVNRVWEMDRAIWSEKRRRGWRLEGVSKVEENKTPLLIWLKPSVNTSQNSSSSPCPGKYSLMS